MLTTPEVTTSKITLFFKTSLGSGYFTNSWNRIKPHSRSTSTKFNMNGRSHVFVLFLLMSTFSSWIQVPTDATSISIDNNAYSNIVVAISPDVADTNAELIIQNIQVWKYEIFYFFALSNFFKFVSVF